MGFRPFLGPFWAMNRPSRGYGWLFRILLWRFGITNAHLGAFSLVFKGRSPRNPGRPRFGAKGDRSEPTSSSTLPFEELPGCPRRLPVAFVATRGSIVGPKGSRNGQKTIPKNLFFHPLLYSPVNPVRDSLGPPAGGPPAERPVGRTTSWPRSARPAARTAGRVRVRERTLRRRCGS